jgi:hypothetical protein
MPLREPGELDLAPDWGPEWRPRRAWWAPSVLLSSALVVVAALLALVAPPPDAARAATRCVALLPLPWGRPLPFGCDGFTFLRGAAEPALLLEPAFAPPTDFTYQSRPLHVGAAAVLGRILQPVAALAIPPDARYQGRAPIRRFAGVYAAYVLLNAGLLVAAGLALQDALLGSRPRIGRAEGAALVAGLAFTILSPTVKTWLFTPHTILWGVLIPLWAVAAARRQLAGAPAGGPAPGRHIGAPAGLAALAYGYAVLVPLAWVAAAGLGPGRATASRARPRGGLRRAAVALALFVLPSLAWVGLSHAVAGGYYHHEAVAYRQFRWPLDALGGGIGGLGAEAVGRARRWGGLAASAWMGPLLALGAAAAAGAATGGSLRGFVGRHRPLLGAAGLVLALGSLFWYLNGEMSSLRAATLAPVVQVVAAALALDLDRQAGRARWTLLLAVATVVAGAAAVLATPAA